MNPRLRLLRKSSTLAINEKSAELEQMGKKIYRFGLGQSPFPVPEEVVEELRRNAHQKDYLPVMGLRQLREQVASHMSSKLGCQYSPEQVIVGPGSKELLFILQLVVDAELILPSPSWVSYIPQARIIGRKIKLLTTGENEHWGLTDRTLETLIEENAINESGSMQLLLLNYPNNPTGTTFTEDELERIADVARRNNILILSDEIYGELSFDGVYRSISRYYPEGTIISTGLSKWCGAGGWRLGVFIFPKELSWIREKMGVVASETYTSVSAPIQYAAVQAFKMSDDIKDYLVHVRRILKHIGTWIANQFIDAGITCNTPEGAFYLFLNFDRFKKKMKEAGINGSIQMCDRLLEETGVAILPGIDFARPRNELTARLAYVNFDGQKALDASKKGVKLDLDFIKKYAPDVYEGVKAITNWVQQFTQ